jgi:hypothetical protein
MEGESIIVLEGTNWLGPHSTPISKNETAAQKMRAAAGRFSY